MALEYRLVGHNLLHVFLAFTDNHALALRHAEPASDFGPRKLRYCDNPPGDAADRRQQQLVPGAKRATVGLGHRMHSGIMHGHQLPRNGQRRGIAEIYQQGVARQPRQFKLLP